jgi:hypothetical protein
MHNHFPFWHYINKPIKKSLSNKPSNNLEEPQPRLPTLGGRLLVAEAVWRRYPRRVTDLSYRVESSVPGITATHARCRMSPTSNMYIDLELHNSPCNCTRSSTTKTNTVSNTVCWINVTFILKIPQVTSCTTRFNIQKLYILLKECINISCMVVQTKLSFTVLSDWFLYPKWSVYCTVRAESLNII